jgi:mRNA-degrading endonuclease YafQ of YafQ-DinJ toxin-antitoxin module
VVGCNAYIYSETKRKQATNNDELTRAIALLALNRPLPEEQRDREIH